MERLTYWKCSECHGTGKVICGYDHDRIDPCSRCDATGNAMVDGETERHKRRIAEIERRKSPDETLASFLHLR